MKIVVYSPTFPPVIDGTSIQAKRLVDLFAKEHETYGLTFLVDRDLKPARYHDTEHIERLEPAYQDRGKFPSLDPQRAVQRVYEIKPDILHLRGWYQLPVIEGMMRAGREIKADVFWHSDGTVECHKNFAELEIYKRVIESAQETNVNFVGYSSNDLAIFDELGINKNRTFCIPPILFATAQHKEKDFSKPTVLYVGRFYPYKGHQKVLEMVKKIDPTMPVILAGAADSLNCVDIVTLLQDNGAILELNPTEECLNDLYENATHFVSASTRETLGISTLEASLAGCLPLARNIGGISDYLDSEFVFDDDVDMEIKSIALLHGPVEQLREKIQQLGDKINVEEVKKSFMKMYEMSL